MKSTPLFSIFIFLVISGLACWNTTSTTVPNRILFTDDFSNTNKKWDQVSNSSGSTDYYDNAYQIIVNIPNHNVWAHPANENFIDTRLDVIATKHAGPNDNDFGIICRYVDESHFYYGIISSDGYYAIMKMTGEGAKPVGKKNMLESNRIKKGASTNYIRFDCIGPKLTLFVNGFKVDQQNDGEYTTGNVGLIAGSFAKAGTDILFDNFVVYKP